MMDKLEELTEYLDRDYGIDYWSDDAIDYASVLLSQFEPEQWNDLFAGWTNHDVEWQVKLAEALCFSGSPRAIDLLLVMLRSKVLDVAVAAAVSLEGNDDVWTPDSSMRGLLQDLFDRATTEWDKDAFATLLEKISDQGEI